MPDVPDAIYGIPALASVRLAVAPPIARDPAFTDPSAGPPMAPRPPAALVALFDGQCSVCTRSAAWIGARDHAEPRIERLDLREDASASRFPAFGHAAVREQLHVIDAAGEVTVGLDAVIAVLGQLPRWAWLGWVLGLPGVHAIAGIGYRWFARNRLWFNRFLPAPVRAGCDHDGACSASGPG